MKVHCKNTNCLHNTSTITGAFGECKRGYIILDTMGMCDVFVKKIDVDKNIKIEAQITGTWEEGPPEVKE